MRTKAGFAAVMGNAETINKKKRISYLAPIQFYPPPWHHLDTDKEDVGTGFERRVEYFDEEEYKKPREIGVDWTIDNGEVEYDKMVPDQINREENPIRGFVNDELEVTGDTTDDKIPKSDIRKAYGEYAQEWGLPPIHENPSQFGERLMESANKIFKGRRSDNTRCYTGVRFKQD
jgi:hypothetical protein